MGAGRGRDPGLRHGRLNQRAARKAVVHLRGGDLKVSWNPEDGHVFIEGPAAEVCTGETRLDEAL